MCLQLSENVWQGLSLLLSYDYLTWQIVKSSGLCAGVTAFSKGGNEGSLYAALLVNGVQWIATIITVISVDKAGPDSPSHSHILLPLISPQHAMPCTAGACYWQDALLPSDAGLTVGIFMLMQVGRRILLLAGSTLGLLADFIVAIVLAVTYSGGANLPRSASIASIVLVQIAPC